MESSARDQSKDVQAPKLRASLSSYLSSEYDLMAQAHVPAWRLFLFWLIRSYAFESVVGLVISLNTALVWYETDYTAFPSTLEAPGWVKALTITSTFIFTAEVVLRLLTLQMQFFKGGFNCDVFDLILVASDLSLLFAKDLLNVDGASIVKALRVARALRVVKAIRIWPAFRELYVMMHGLLGAFKAMMWSAVLLFLILAIFGIIAVEAVNPVVHELAAHGAFPEDCDRCERAFQTVWGSMITFFQQVVAGDSWGMITLPVMEASPMLTPFFLLVVVTIQFGILNLILVAIVDQSHKASHDDAAFQAMSRAEEYDAHRSNVEGLCKHLDRDGDGEISLDELLEGYNSLPELANALKFLEVGRDDLAILFSALDTDGSGSLSYEEFVDQLFSIRHQDSSVLLSFVRSYVQDIRKTLQQQEKAIARIDRKLAEGGGRKDTAIILDAEHCISRLSTQLSESERDSRSVQICAHVQSLKKLMEVSDASENGNYSTGNTSSLQQTNASQLHATSPVGLFSSV